jgi:GTPase Era involved in 16S rRNA processing
LLKPKPAAGVTRDRLYTRANWGAREFVLVDTGGLMSEAAKLPEAQQSAAMREISDRELPQVYAAVSPEQTEFRFQALMVLISTAAIEPADSLGASGVPPAFLV